MSSQQIQSSKLKTTNRNLRIYKPLAPKPSAVKPLTPKVLAPKPLAPKPLASKPLAPKPLALTPQPKPISLSLNQNFSDEMGVNSNFLMEYRTDTLMIPRANEELDYSLRENNQENCFYEEDIPIDILDVEEECFNTEDLMVS